MPCRVRRYDTLLLELRRFSLQRLAAEFNISGSSPCAGTESDSRGLNSFDVKPGGGRFGRCWYS